nr:MAG TPA: hypothetical protein [Caudoviricetes sp.]
MCYKILYILIVCIILSYAQDKKINCLSKNM